MELVAYISNARRGRSLHVRALSFEVTLDSNSLLNFILIVIVVEKYAEHTIFEFWLEWILCEPRFLQRNAALLNPPTDGTSREASFARTLIKYFNIFSPSVLGIISSTYMYCCTYMVSKINMHWLIFFNNIIWLPTYHIRLLREYMERFVLFNVKMVIAGSLYHCISINEEKIYYTQIKFRNSTKWSHKKHLKIE